MDNNELKQAKAVYDTVCAAFDDAGLKYGRDDEHFAIISNGVGDDLPIELLVRIHTKNRVLALHSRMPFTVPEGKRDEIALATSMINNKIIDGSFDYDYLNGKVMFRFTTAYRDSLIGKDTVNYMLSLSVTVVDKYNDLLLKLACGGMTLDEFAAAL